MRVHLAALRARLLRTPDDPTAWKLLTDALQEVGDPRGRLALLERSPHHVADAHAWRFTHRRTLLGPLLDHELAWPVVWRWGHVYQLHVEVPRRPEPALRLLEELDRFGIRQLRLVCPGGAAAVVDAVMAIDWPMLAGILAHEPLGVPIRRDDVEVVVLPMPAMGDPLFAPPEQLRARRFERGSSSWSVRREGAVLHTERGDGVRVRADRATHDTPREAARVLIGEVRARVREGFEEVLVPLPPVSTIARGPR